MSTIRRSALIVALLFPVAVAAQSPAGNSAPDGIMLVFQSFGELYGSRLVAAFESIPAARYEYRPTAAQQTIGYIAQHLENANYSLCASFSNLEHRVTTKDSLPDTVKARWPKDTLIARLKASLDFCDAAIDRGGPMSPGLARSLLQFETDLAEHYSQLSSYMRLLGLVPPSALRPKQRTAIELPVSALTPYVGRYQFAPGWEIRVTMEKAALFGQSTLGGPPVHLWPESGSDFFLEGADGQIRFTRDASGAVTGLVARQFGRDRVAKKIQ